MSAERKIFQFHDGTRLVFVDPFALHRAWYEATGGKPHELLLAVQPPETQKVVMPDGSAKDVEPEESDEQYLARLRAYAELIVAARQAFELPCFDKATGAGVLDNDVIRILHEWQNWQDGVKKNSDNSVTSAPPTTSTPKAGPAPTKKPSPSGSSPGG